MSGNRDRPPPPNWRSAPWMLAMTCASLFRLSPLLRALFPSASPALHRMRTGVLGALLTFGLAWLLLGPSGSVQAQNGPPPPENLSCTASTEQVVFLWEAAEWSGGEPAHFDYEITLPGGRKEAMRARAYSFTRSMTVRRPGSYQPGQEFRLWVKTLYETAGGQEAISAEATLVCRVGEARPLVITPNSPTREYGGADDLSYTVSGLVDGDAAGDVVSGTLARLPGDDAGSYTISMSALAVASQYATKYRLPAAPAVAAYTITPKPAAYTGTAPAKRYDGTATVTGALSGSFAAGDILTGDVVTVNGGSYVSADAGTGIAISGVSSGGADAANYAVTISVSGDITPRTITAISGVSVNSRLTDGTTGATFDTGSAQGTGVLPAELADFRAGGLAVSGAFPSAEAGSYDVSATYSLQDHGSFKASNYTLSAGASRATLRGEIQDEQAQPPVPTPTPAPTPTPTPTPSPTPGTCQTSSVQPVAVAVSDVPIVVASTTADYFVLYVRPDLDTDFEIPVSVTLGQDGTTTLTEQLAALPKAHYRVEKYRIANPADVDGDCIDDITELRDLGTRNPVNPAKAIDVKNGTVAVPDRETFERISYKGDMDDFDVHLADLEFVKFYLAIADRPIVYFMNTTNHQAHNNFYSALLNDPNYGRQIIRILGNSPMMGDIVYHPNAIAPDGSLGVYRFAFQPSDAYSFEKIAYANEVLAANMPFLENNLAYHPLSQALPRYNREKSLYDASRINVLLEEDIFPDVDFISLNQGEGYGYLQSMSPEETPQARDIVIYETLPNDLPRVAGIITTVPQTPLSHVNLRAVQDDIPNAFIRDAMDDSNIDDLLGNHVHYQVTRSGYTLRAATKAEVDAHYESSRPAEVQTPERDLSVTKITALSSIGFDDWDAFGVKAANVAVLGTLNFPEGTVPGGFAVPFYFYDEFMKNAVLAEETLFGKKKWDDDDKFTLPAGTKLSAVVTAMLAHRKFQTDYEIQEEMLDDLRDAIKDAESPQWIIDALTAMHATYPEGQSLRYRSSTNNEDLPGFSGAGLYDSKTQDPDETTEDGIDKSIKGVWASLWNFRAFVERDFHRIDHTRTAMGVLVHPNYSDEPVNGVAVSFDPFSGREGAYYVNTQVGEDLVTNPEAHSAPEAILLLPDGSHNVLAYSNQKDPRGLLMTDAQMRQLRGHLTVIHDRFKALYQPAAGEPFAMEVEFKITSANILAIKQARPWVFARSGSGSIGDVPVARIYADLIAKMYEWRNDPQWVGEKSHTDRWDRALLAFGETVADTTLTPMTAAEAQAFADRGDAWSHWVSVAAALREIEAAGQQQQQATPNQAPTISASIADITIVHESATYAGSLSGVFDDANGDTLTITAASSDEATATVSVATDYSTLTVSTQARGTAVITVTADDGNGGTVDDAFTVTVKAAPVVASALSDISGLESGATQDVFLDGVFSDADGDSLTITAAFDDEAIATVSVASDGSSLTLTGVSEGTATITVTAQDSDGNRVSDSFDVEVAAPQQQAPPNQAPTVSAAITDATIVSESGTRQVSLSGVFDDADNDSLTVTAASSDEAKATASVASDGSSLTVTAKSRGTATVTVTADDGNGGTVSDAFTVTVKAAPVVASALSDISGLESGATQDVSLDGVFSDADGDSLTITAASSDETKATVSVASDGSSLTLAGVAEGTATITVTAQDSDGNSVSDAFEVEVAKRYAALIAQMYEWREDPQWRHRKSHTDRWDRALLAFGETVADSSLTAMTAAEAQSWADSGLSRWVSVAAALWEIEGGGRQQQTNQAPTVSAAITDATIVSESGTRQVSLSGVFDDADNDSLTVTAASSDEAKATASVASDGSSLTVTAKARGTSTVTVTASDGNGGTVDDAFTVTVKAAPMVASALADVTGLEVGDTRNVSLSGVFSDPDGDTLTITAASSDDTRTAVTVASDGSSLTVAGVSAGTATVTVTAQDSDGNRVSDSFDVEVAAQQQAVLNQAPTVAAAIADATIVNDSATQTVSLSGVFDDADGDALTVSAASSDEAKATVSVSADYTSLTVTAKSKGTATITVTANDGNGGTAGDAFTVTVKAAPVVASTIANMNRLETGDTRDVSLSGVFSDPDGDTLTITAASSDDTKATVTVASDGATLTVAGVSEGTATITVTAQDADGNRVSDDFGVAVASAEVDHGDPAPVSNLSCVAQTGRVLFSWDAPQWSGAAVYAYDYDLTLPDGRREQSRLQGYPAVSGKGEYQAGQQASISVKAVYELADGSEVYSEAATLSCTVKE